MAATPVIAVLDDLKALARAAKAAITPMEGRLSRIHNGFMSHEGAAQFREKVAEVGRYRAEPERVEPLFTQVPRMATATRTVQKLVPRPGKRTYAGFIFQDVEVLVDAMGLDLGITDRAACGCFL